MKRGNVPSGSRAAHTFSRAPQASIPRSSFNRSHGVKTTFDEGLLIPILVDEILPGDTLNLQMHSFARLATPIFPIMDNLYLETFFFAVPYRLVWSNWEKFNGYQINPGDSVDYVVPQVSMPDDVGAGELSLSDYFGIPTKVPKLRVNSLHYRAYNLIWNEWFRDENLQDSVSVPMGDADDSYSSFNVLRRGKRYDYFTSALPWPQKGPAVEIPIGDFAPVVSNGLNPYIYADGGSKGLVANTLGGISYSGGNVSENQSFTWNASETGMQADLSVATLVTINDLRLAVQTQKLFERDARGGTRYVETIKSHFGVTSPDARLQRPEYLGGGSTPININPVAQTSATSGTNALGDLAAFGTCSPKGHGFTYSSTEHQLLIGLVVVRADINYQQGLDRMWSRQTRLDYYWPALSHIGEQAILNKEIYAQGPDVQVGDVSVDDMVFGYQERYAEYRYKPSQITGRFRSNCVAPLDSWHLAQDFGSLPLLNEEFIVEDAPMSRVIAVSTEPDFIFDCFFSYKCVRPMPVYSVPGYMDHF